MIITFKNNPMQIFVLSRFLLQGFGLVKNRCGAYFYSRCEMVRFDCLSLADKTTCLQKLLLDNLCLYFFLCQFVWLSIKGECLSHIRTDFFLRTKLNALSVTLTILASFPVVCDEGFEALGLFIFALSGNGPKYVSQC